jgi:hypothetical protein
LIFKQLIVLGVFCAIFAAISGLIVKLMGMAFIGILTKFRESFMAKSDGMNTLLFSGDKDILIEKCCFWICFHLNDSIVPFHDH